MTTPPRILGRYALYDEIAAGGMATVHLGRLLGPVGFGRTVAIKRLHPQYSRDEEFVAMFLDEARLAARIQHPNVVQTIDIVQTDGELFLVMEYVRGESLAFVRRALHERGERMPPEIAIGVMAGALYGLHDAHEATTESGDHLGLVHRDVSPQNILLGVDGIPRVLDFGVAKASARLTSTRGGNVKGKLGYMAPEQLRGSVDRRTDVYAAGIVMWEMLTGQRCFRADNDGQLVMMVTEGCTTPPSELVPGISPALDAAVMSALVMNPDERCPSARELAIRLETALRPATGRELSEYLVSVAGPHLAESARRVAEIERASVEATPAPVAATTAHREEASSPTHLTATAPPPRAAASHGLLWAVLGVSTIVVAGGAGALLMSSGAKAPSAPTSRVDASTPAAAPAVASSSAPVAAAPAAPSTASPAASASAAPPAPADTAAAGKAVATAATAATAGARPAAKPSKAACDPPFTIDQSGVKRYKPECL